jgi:uncharacterized protein involved in exopolysaccharide biosynthesis
MPDEDLNRRRSQTPAPTVREVAAVLFRRWRVFVWTSGLLLTVAVLYLLAGARYEAEMKILVRPGRADAPVSAQENAPLDLTRLEITEEELNSEVELLQDESVLRRVVEEIGLGGRDWLHFLRLNEGHAERVERAARRLGKKLKVEAVKKTNLITVKYASEDPRTAARVLQSLADAYVEKHAIVHRPNGELHFFEKQTGESRQQLEEVQQKLLDFMGQHEVVVAGQERDMALQRLSVVDASNHEARVELAETKERVRELENQLKDLPERTTTQIRSADNPEVLAALKSTLIGLQVKRVELLTKFEPAHPLVQEVEQQITQTQAAISAENQAPVRDETTDKDTHYEWAKSELQRAQVQLKGLEARAAATGTQEVEYRAMARRLGEDAIAQDDLVNTEHAAEYNYLLYVKKKEAARMADALDERGIVNVAIAEQPVAPALPRWSAWTVLAVGLAAGSVAGTGAAFAADHVDAGFHTPDDVLAYLDAPVLASLPRSAQRRLPA